MAKCHICRHSGNGYVPGWFLCRKRRYKTIQASKIKHCGSFRIIEELKDEFEPTNKEDRKEVRKDAEGRSKI